MNIKKTPVKTGEKLVGNKETQFKKGNDPKRNLNGRPKGSFSLLTLLKKELQKSGSFIMKDGKRKKIMYAKALIRKVLKKAITDEDVQMMKDILNRVDGMPKQSVGVENEGLNVIISYADEKQKITDKTAGKQQKK